MTYVALFVLYDYGILPVINIIIAHIAKLVTLHYLSIFGISYYIT